jgi:lysophospholipase L1-like esterase
MRRGTPTLEETADAYALAVRRIREKLPDTPIFLVACFPTRGKYEPMAGLVRDLDNRIRTIAEAEGDLVHFIDTWTPFADEQGLLKQEFTADGLHLNPKGHKVFSPILRESLIAHGIQPDIPTR